MRRALVGYDDSPAARSALTWGLGHVQREHGDLVVAYVSSSALEWELAAVQVNADPLVHEFERRLREEWTAPLREAGVTYETRVLHGRPADALLRCAQQEDAELIVVGMTGRGTVNELLMGSTTHQLLHHAARPIVAVPAGWRLDGSA
jgi:nucleotide-binding universal stress UspA family protein